jgi:FlaA1/EpsC-like NDP-sugar epimerase
VSKRIKQFINPKNHPVYRIDTVLLSMTLLLSLELRLSGKLMEGINNPSEHIKVLCLISVIFLVLKIATLKLFGIYKCSWRYAGIDELTKLSFWGISIILIQTIVLAWMSYIHPVFDEVPVTVAVIDGIIGFLIIGLSRLSRLSFKRMRQRAQYHHQAALSNRTLIVGAGYAGIRLVETIQRERLPFTPVAFVDDDKRKQTLLIRNVPVVGRISDLSVMIEKYSIQKVIIAIPSAPGTVIRQVAEICQAEGIPTSIIPATEEILENSVKGKPSLLRDIRIEDLLRRDPIVTDLAGVKALVQGKRVLVTGAGGSIGSEICRQILRHRPVTLALLGKGENSIFSIQQELEKQLSQMQLEDDESGALPAVMAFITDIRSIDRLSYVFETVQPEVIFHAAAHKHVPLMELNPPEAISSNVIGTANLLQMANHHQVERFVMISTDKAVNPTNVMGASKRMAEMLVLQAAKRSNTSYMVVRFGNVLGSRGSVVPTFKRQIAEGGPIQITHPDICRYFMTIPEAVQLTLQAAVMGNGGTIMMFDMGNPVKIVDLAADLIRLSGYEVDRDIKITFTGLRPGEKLYEELFIPGEKYERTQHEKIMLVHNASQSIPVELDAIYQSLCYAAQQNNSALIVSLMEKVVSGYEISRANAISMKQESVPTLSSLGLHTQHADWESLAKAQPVTVGSSDQARN